MLLSKCQHDCEHEIVFSIVEKSNCQGYGFFLNPIPQAPPSMLQHLYLPLTQKTNESPKPP